MSQAPGIHFLEAGMPTGLRVYAIGDVHGRVDLLQAMHRRIREEIERDRPDDWRIVHLGDYVDRGAWSRETLGLLVRETADPRVIALRGNHDQGLLDFLDRPAEARLFMRHGGAETAASYRVEADFSSDAAILRTRDALHAAMPGEHAAFLRQLPTSIEFGDFFFCHAGIRPGVALADQSDGDLMWIRSEFLDWPHLHPRVVVHGHTPASDAEIRPNRVNVDTMAYASGRLTALVADGRDKRIVEVAD